MRHLRQRDRGGGFKEKPDIGSNACPPDCTRGVWVGGRLAGGLAFV